MKISHFKALALFSGGLDSILAVKIIQLQNIDVEGIVFQSPFFNTRLQQSIADKLKIKLHFNDITNDIIKIIENPKYGFGKNLNPCIDCHLCMVKKAGDMLKEIKADFLITGEVVGERPKSQNYKALKLIADESGYGKLLLRPLSAKKLEETEVEKKGIVDRKKLFGISGKNRKPQIKLAEEYGINYYPTPAGGCLLTMPRFSDRLRVNLKMKKLSPRDLALLKCGRHFLTGENIKIVIGRNEEDNYKILDSIDDSYYIVELADTTGPVAVIDSLESSVEHILKTGSLVARYSKLRTDKSVKIKYYRKNHEIRFADVKPKSFQQLGWYLV